MTFEFKLEKDTALMILTLFIFSTIGILYIRFGPETKIPDFLISIANMLLAWLLGAGGVAAYIRWTGANKQTPTSGLPP